MINPFKKTYTPKEMNIFRFLKKIKVFENLDYEELSLFIPHLHEREYKKDEVVFLRNDPSHALYLLRKGEVALSIYVNESFEKLTSVKDGESIGDSCLLKDTKRQLNAIVASDGASFYVMPQVSILNIFENNVTVKAKMLESLAELYNYYNASLFKAYKSSLGFFDLGLVYTDNK